MEESFFHAWDMKSHYRMIEENRPAQCKICEGLQISPGYVIDGMVYYRCRSCRHLFLWPKPSEEGTTSLYEDPTYYDAAEARSYITRHRHRHTLAVLGAIIARHGLEKVLLDVGCATGNFLDEATRNGWAVCGQEISAPLAASARKRYGFEVRVGAVEQLDFGRRFPVVPAWEVLEHSRDQKKFVESIKNNLLLPGGLLAVTTPLSDGIPAKIMGRKFPMLLPREHLCLFSRKSIRLAMCRSNFEIVHSESFSDLDSKSLASGMTRFLGSLDRESAPAPIRWLTGAAGRAFSFFPRVVDRAGLGTELFLICRAPELSN